MTGLSAGVSEKLMLLGLDPGEVERVVRAALAEDLSFGADVTTVATIPAGMNGEANVVARAGGVVAGLFVAGAVFDVVRPDRTARLSVMHRVADGDRVSPGEVLMCIQGPLRAILTGERTALNILTHLSGVASLT